MDPLGPMSMPKIVGRVADRAGRGQQGPGTIVARIFVMAMFVIIIAFAVMIVVFGH